MKVKLLSIILCSILLTGCNQNNGKNNPNPPAPTWDEYVVDFSSLDLGSSNILQSQDGTFKTKVLSFLNNSMDNIVTDISFTGNNKVKIEKSEFPAPFEQVQGLILGSQSDDGYLQFEFTKELLSVTFTIQQYYNIVAGYDGDPHNYPYYDGQEYNYETEEYEGYTKIEVNEVSHEIESISFRYDDNGYAYCDIPPVVEELAALGGNSLIVNGLAGMRTRIYSMKFLFRK